MQEEIANVTGQKVSEVVGKYVDSLLAYSKSKIDSTLSKRFYDLKTYLEKAYGKCSVVKLMIDRDRLYSIKKVYVKSNFVSNKGVYGDDHILQRVESGGNIVVQGFGGIGKTMLLKSLWMSIFEKQSGKIPIFVELRRLNDLNNKALVPYLRAHIAPDNSTMSEVIFNEFARDGRFIFLFDGFDELNDEFRREIGNQISNLAYNSPKCGFIVSSRFDDYLYSWEQFEVYRANPFTKDQIIDVISNVTFDSKVKKRFISDVLEQKYHVYDSFLSTPLLALMMLLTYDQFADVPEKVHIFYRYAFQTLYSLHDAAKESFQRKRKTSLNEDDFCKVFSIFCLLTYKDMKFVFDEISIKKYVDASKERSFIEVDSDDFISELIESVNLIYREGNLYSFVHRSFQEYFCAFAMVNYYHDKIKDIIERMPRRGGDSVFSMAYEMNPDLIESKVLLPAYEAIRDTVQSVIAKTSNDDLLLRTGSTMLVIGGRMGSKKRPEIQFSVYISNLDSSSFMYLVEQLKRGYFSDIPDLANVDGDHATLAKSLFQFLEKKYIDQLPDNFRFEFDLGKRQISAFTEFYDDDIQLIPFDIEFRKEIWNMLFRQESSKKHNNFAIWIRARYVALAKAVAEMNKRSKKRAALDDQLFDLPRS